MTSVEHTLQSRFFNASTPRAQLLNITDSLGYAAIAVSILDKGLSNQLNFHAVEKIKHSFVHLNPNTSVKSVLAKHFFQALKQHFPMHIVVLKIAHALQYAVLNHLLDNPIEYRIFFDKLNDKHGIQAMLAARIDGMIFRLISQLLHVNIKVYDKLHHYDIPAISLYRQNPSAASLSIEMCGDYFFPSIIHKDLFQSAQLTHITFEKPDTLDGEMHAKLSMILPKLDAHAKTLLNQFHKIKTRFQTMISAQEMNLNDLLALYIRMRPLLFSSSMNEIRHLTLLARRYQSDTKLLMTHTLTMQLVDALAASTALGRIDENELFNDYERNTTHSMKLSIK